MFVVLQIGRSGRHPWVRQGTGQVTLLWLPCPGLEMLDWFGWDRTSRPRIISVWRLRGLRGLGGCLTRMVGTWAGLAGQGPGPEWLAVALWAFLEDGRLGVHSAPSCMVLASQREHFVGTACPLKSRPGPGQASPLPVSAGCSCHRSTPVQGGVGGVGRWLLVGEWRAGLAREGRGDSISETRDPLPLSVLVEGKACCLHSRLGQGMSFQATGFRVQIQVLTLTSLFTGLQSYKDVASTDGAPTT